MRFVSNQLSPLGAEVLAAGVDLLLEDDELPAKILDLLEVNGVLVFRRLDLDDERQLAFARRLGEPVVRHLPGWSKEHPGVYNVSLDPRLNDAVYQKGSTFWHLDGSTQDIPSKATLLTGRVLPNSGGGDTQFASTYAAYDLLSTDEKVRFADLKVWHSVAAGYRLIDPDPTPEVLERLQHADPPILQPLIWTHRDGRKSLVLGATASHIEGMPEAEGAALLEELLARATEPSRVYTHQWQVGDLVIWDNRGVVHRVTPYREDSGREMHRVMLAGEEAIT